MLIRPAFPCEAKPVLNSIDPDAPLFDAFAEPMKVEPECDVRSPPLTMATLPPVAVESDVVPAKTTRSPP